MNSKRRLELQNQHNFQQLQQQQQQQQNCDDDMIIDEPPFKKHRPGVAANILYKVVEFAAYTSAFATDAINTITGGHSTRRIYHYDDEVLQIRTDDENEVEDSYDQKIDKKDESSWGENVENEEEPPPPYDSTWSMPSPSSYTTDNKLPETRSFTTEISSSSSQPEFSSSQQPLTSKPQTHTNSRRRQFRVRRGRRLLRRKTSSADLSNNFNSSSYTQPENNEEEDIFLKFNCKLADMIAEGKAALNSKVDVTDVEMMIAEEKERDERIMREFGIQTPINRRARRYTSSSSDYEYFSSLLN